MIQTNTASKTNAVEREKLVKLLRKAELCQDWRAVERIERKIAQLS